MKAREAYGSLRGPVAQVWIPLLCWIGSPALAVGILRECGITNWRADFWAVLGGLLLGFVSFFGFEEEVKRDCEGEVEDSILVQIRDVEDFELKARVLEVLERAHERRHSR
jgi:hypothetical protein